MITIDSELVEQLRARTAQLESRMAEAAVSQQHQSVRALVRELARTKRIMEKAQAVLSLIRQQQECSAVLAQPDAEEEFRQLAQSEMEQAKTKQAALEKEFMQELLPPDPNEERNVIMEIRAGTGGEEAALFAADLCRMYTRYAESRGWKTELMDASPSELGGYKEVIFAVKGENVYGRLRFEGGTHRVQRVPVTEASGRIHTSAATVAVLPEADSADEIEIKPEDLKTDVFRASGAGGQHVNKTDSAVRLTHLPTGIVVKSQDERSQHRNREKAMSILRARLLAVRQAEEAAKLGSARRAQIGSGDRSERIRTYNFPQNRVTDHRIGLTLYQLDRVMEGELEPLLAALREQHIARRLEQEQDSLQAVLASEL